MLQVQIAIYLNEVEKCEIYAVLSGSSRILPIFFVLNFLDPKKDFPRERKIKLKIKFQNSFDYKNLF